ncbi:flagellar hook-length control protein FliK [Billgrantia antri]|uniref:flagellar hook-length control protein FliK n=1 Tax=Billgrantia antri TaxID=2846777 RepID=UPI003B218603
MNIQMILSTLPTPLSGQPEANAEQGQFALALSQATQGAQTNGAALPISLKDLPGQGLPQTMAAQQALLQALSAHVGQPPGGKTEAALPDAELREIMARLALIDDSYQQASPGMAAVQPLSEQEASFPTAETSAEFGEQPQAAALVAAVVAEAQRPGTTLPEQKPLGEAVVQAGKTAAPNPTNTGNSLTAAPAALALQDTDGDASAPARPVDFANIATKATAPQPGIEPRAVASEARTGGFVPESAPLSPASTSPAAPVSASAQAASLATPFSQASLAAPLQSPAWPSQLGQQLVQFARQGGEQQIEMRLNPADLGPLSVTLKMTEQGAQAQFLSAHAQVRQVLEQAIPQLREALAEQGISLGEASVGEQRQQNAQAFAGQDDKRGPAAQAPNEGDLALSGAEELGVTPSSTTLSLDGRVNLYA